MDPPLDRTSAGVVLKPCFHNRRSESSVHLKNSFPAGFKSLPTSKSLVALDVGKQDDSLASASRSQFGAHPSYMAWAKGSAAYLSDDFIDESHFTDGSKVHIDPLAAMAGPYYSDMMKAKRDEAAKKFGKSYNALIDPNSCLVSIDSHEIYLHNREDQKILAQKNRMSPPKRRVFHAPSSLPTFSARLNNSKLVHTLSLDSLSSGSHISPEYESWLADRRSNNDSRAWTIKGNQPDINYSAYDFHGNNKFNASAILNLRSLDDSEESSINSKLQRLGSPKRGNNNNNVINAAVTAVNLSSTSKLPSLILPPLLSVEIYTLNHVVKSNSLLNDTQFISKQIPSTMTLEEIKQLVIREIVLGIEKAFKITESEMAEEMRRSRGDQYNSSSNNRMAAVTPIDTTQIQLDFQYYNPSILSWRECNNEFEWLTAKQTLTEHSFNESQGGEGGVMIGPVIQLMHSLEKNSEFLLLQQIQHNYQSRMKYLKMKESQVSLDHLTKKLSYPQSSVATNNSRHKFQEVTVPSYQLHAVMTDSRPSSAKYSTASSKSRRSIDSNNEASNLTILKKSVLYPRMSAATAAANDERSKLAERQQQIAVTLQNRLIKTKF